MTATESSNRTLPCLSGPAATSVPAKWWVCLLADTCGRKNMTSSYWEKWHQLSSLSSVNTNMQLHIRLKWSEVRPRKGAGIYHTVQLCSVITCTCYQDAVWLCSEGRAKLVITDITKKNKPTNQPKTKQQQQTPTTLKLTATATTKPNQTIPSPNPGTPQKWRCFLPCLPEILLSWVTPGRQISAKKSLCFGYSSFPLEQRMPRAQFCLKSTVYSKPLSYLLQVLSGLTSQEDINGISIPVITINLYAIVQCRTSWF